MASSVTTDLENSRTQAPNLATRILALPVEIRDLIWSFYFGHTPLRSIHYHNTYFARPYTNSLSMGEKAILIFVTKDIYLEVSHWLYKNVKVVKFYNIEHFDRFFGKTTRMGPFVHNPRVEFIRRCESKIQARAVAQEALTRLHGLLRAYSNRTRRESDEPEPKPKWTATLELVKREEILETFREPASWQVVLLPRDSIVSQQQHE